MRWTPQETLILGTADTRLEARCWGPPPEEAPTLVLLHEGLGCVALWRDFPERLARSTGWGVLAWSRAGYGRSDPCPLPRPLDYMEREAALLPEVLDVAGIRSTTLVGHSDGGSIAALAGAARDPRVTGLILIAPHFFVEDCSVAAVAAARDAYATGLRDRLAKYHDDPDCAFHGWNDTWLNPGFRAWDITWCLERVDVPVLAIQGAEDPYGTAQQITGITGRCPAPVATHLLPGCGHAPHLEVPDALLELITGFTKNPALRKNRDD